MGQIDKNLKNELFKVAIDYIYREHLVGSQGELAEKIGISASALSRIMNDKKFVGDDTLRKMNEAFGGIFNMAYFRGEDPHCMLMEDLAYYKQHPEERLVFDKPQEVAPTPHQPAIPDYVQKLFDEAVRMSTRNELLERQCEKLIGELRDTKEKNETFLSELRKSKEYNDALVADLVISRKQNEVLITELRETRKENATLTTKLKAAIEGIESMKNQVSMLVSSYNVVAPQSPTFVNDMPDSIVPVIKFPIANVVTGSHANYVGVVPEGLIRGHQVVADEVVKKALKEMNKAKSKKKK